MDRSRLTARDVSADSVSVLDDVEAIDRVVHEPARLAIMAQLSVLEEADFVYLLNATKLTRGNLGSHIGRLESAGYIEVQKRFQDRSPQTILRLTPAGRKALASWRDSMALVVRALASLS